MICATLIPEASCLAEMHRESVLNTQPNCLVFFSFFFFFLHLHLWNSMTASHQVNNTESSDNSLESTMTSSCVGAVRRGIEFSIHMDDNVHTQQMLSLSPSVDRVSDMGVPQLLCVCMGEEIKKKKCWFTVSHHWLAVAKEKQAWRTGFPWNGRIWLVSWNAWRLL